MSSLEHSFAPLNQDRLSPGARILRQLLPLLTIAFVGCQSVAAMFIVEETPAIRPAVHVDGTHWDSMESAQKDLQQRALQSCETGSTVKDAAVGLKPRDRRTEERAANTPAVPDEHAKQPILPVTQWPFPPVTDSSSGQQKFDLPPAAAIASKSAGSQTRVVNAVGSVPKDALAESEASTSLRPAEAIAELTIPPDAKVTGRLTDQQGNSIAIVSWPDGRREIIRSGRTEKQK